MAMHLLIVDDDEDTRDFLARWATKEGLHVGCAGNANEAFELLGQTSFDVAVVDLVLPGMSGAKLISRLKALEPSMAFIILTGHPSIDSAIEAVRDEAIVDYHLKQRIDLTRLMASVKRGGTFRAQRFIGGNSYQILIPEAFGLTNRETEVAVKVAEGLDTSAIAGALGIREGTVRNHLSEVYGKLGVTTRSAAVALLGALSRG